MMENIEKSPTALFDVYLRLRPSTAKANQSCPLIPTPARFLTVEHSSEKKAPMNVVLNPPNDNRRRAVEKFSFTRVFEEDASQLDIFEGTGVLPLIEGVVGANNCVQEQDGLLATLGVTGSGKTYTIQGSRDQSGLTQLALAVLFKSISSQTIHVQTNTNLHATIASLDPAEARVLSAQHFLETVCGDGVPQSHANSRAPTPINVRQASFSLSATCPTIPGSFPMIPGEITDNRSPTSIRTAKPEEISVLAPTKSSFFPDVSSAVPSFMHLTAAAAKKYVTKTLTKGEVYPSIPTPRRIPLQRPSVAPQLPDVSNVKVDTDPDTGYTVVISMYEVYNDRIFDLLTPPIPTKSSKDFKRRPLLFKSTEQSPDRKVVAGLRKIICSTLTEALMVLESGLHERRVAGTGSNTASSRSHGFFCLEVKKRREVQAVTTWSGSTLTIVDLAGSERARDANTQGATLAEAGKINESLMYLGQCLQMQSDPGNSMKPNLVPFRQCKLTELLFSSSFPSSSATSTRNPSHYRNPQKAIMIVTADPLGDFNATSQILRYSALAREITVPRIPSVTSTIFPSTSTNPYHAAKRRSPTSTERETMELAALQIARMSEEIDGLRDEISYEQQKRMEAESQLSSMEERILEIEIEVRESLFEEMESRMRIEIERCKARWVEERECTDGILDRKVDILMRGVGVGDGDAVDEDGEDKENEGLQEDLWSENQRLMREVEVLRREVACQSPARKFPLRDRGHGLKGENFRGSCDLGKKILSS